MAPSWSRTWSVLEKYCTGKWSRTRLERVLRQQSSRPGRRATPAVRSRVLLAPRMPRAPTIKSCRASASTALARVIPGPWMSFLFGGIPYKFMGHYPQKGRTSRVQVEIHVCTSRVLPLPQQEVPECWRINPPAPPRKQPARR